MIEDVVVDTNVLVHSSNPSNSYFDSSRKALEEIRNQDILICVDDVFSIDSDNTSVLGTEYVEHVRSGTIAYFFLLDRIMNGKIRQITKKDFSGIKRELIRKISNRYDIAFVIVAYGSREKNLITNDFCDFDYPTREYLGSSIGIKVEDSYEFVKRVERP